jgi:fructan beta-fructosidase
MPAEDGRRIMIPWMSGDFRTLGYQGMPFKGQFGFPSRLTLRTLPEGIRLSRQPVAEIGALHGQSHTWSDCLLTTGEGLPLDVNTDIFDMRMTFEAAADAHWVLTIRGESIRYDGEKDELSCFDKTALLPTADGRIEMQILVDRTSIEIYARDGAFCMTGYTTNLWCQ